MITKKLMLYFPTSETEKPIVYHLVKDFDLVINIFRAKVTPEDEGYLVLDISGKEDNIEKGIEFIRSLDIDVSISQIGIRWDRDICSGCGACIPHCPTKALSIPDRTTMAVQFDSSQCIECLSCIKVCPFGACSSLF